MAVEWSKLPSDLLELIAERLLINIEDYIRFRAVCAAWRSATIVPLHRNAPLTPKLPWLMLSFDESSDVRSFYRLSDGKVLDFELPEARDNRIVGCAGGWLVLVDKTSAIRLLNPLTKAQVHLPALTTPPGLLARITDAEEGYDYEEKFVFTSPEGERKTINSNRVRDLFVSKVILSSTDATRPVDTCMMMANPRWVDRLVFAKVGAVDEWTVAENIDHQDYAWSEIMCYRDNFYAVHGGAVFVCEIGPPAKATPITAMIDSKAFWYLVESSGELLVVAPYLADPSTFQPTTAPRTGRFEVYRLENLSSQPKLEKLDSLRERILFLGTNRSVSVSTTDFPQLKRNCIYFTASCFHMCYSGNHSGDDFGVFNVQNQGIEPLPCYPNNFHFIWPPPIWFTPSLSLL